MSIKFTIVAICLALLIPTIVFAGKLYKWVDKDGVINVTNDPEKIPPEYREVVEEWNPNKDVSNKPTVKEIGKEKSSKKEGREEISFKKVLVPVIIALIIALLVYIAIYEYKKKEKERRLRALKSSNIDNMDGIEFEDYVSRLLAHRGFKVEVTKDSVALGIDVIAQKNDLRYAVQVKQHVGLVPKLAVSDAVSGKYHYGCNAAIVVTNSYFTEGAIELARSTECELIDRDTLAEWIIGFQTSKG